MTNEDSDSVTPIDTATNTAGAAITVRSTPIAVAITPDGKTAYVANFFSNSVTPIDTATNTAGAAITVGGNPRGVAITPDGKTAYVTNFNSGSVTPIDTSTNTAGAAITVGINPFGVAITPDGKTAYVTNQGSNSVTPIDTATNTAGPVIAVGRGPVSVAITPDGKTAYVTNQGSGSVTPIDTATNTAGSAITLASITPVAVAITPDGKTAYVTNLNSGSVTPIDTSTNTRGPAIAVGGNPSGVAITPDGKTAYVANFGLNSVTPIDTATNTAGSAIAVGSAPFGIAVTPDQPPVAAFSATAAGVGQASRFDASGSSDPDGTVASYRWEFGDGSSQTTATATTTHTYASTGNHTVTLTVTDDAGCSTRLVFTGQTASCNGSQVARVSHLVSVSAATPTIATQPQPATATVGTSIADRATVSGGFKPTGTVTFSLYDNPSGAGSPLFTDTEPLANGTATSKGYTATAAGTDYWVATYHGDPNNLPVSSGAREEPVTVHAVRFATRVRIAAPHTAPLRRGCVVETGLDPREITATPADAICRTLRLTLSGTIQTRGRRAASSAGTIRVRYRVRLPRGLAAGGARARVSHGRWRISLVLPGVNLDPAPPLYLITVRYSGDPTHRQAGAQRRIRLESERGGL